MRIELTQRLPSHFLWTRYGPEAGEPADAVLRRKEFERRGNSGLFLWGIGNNVAPAVRELLARTGDTSPVVVFSPMRSAPRKEDVHPRAVARWTRAIGLDSKEWRVPAASLVTSRMDDLVRKRRHYALVCRMENALIPNYQGPRFSIEEVRNFVSGARVGHSQVTSVVRYTCQDGKAGEYLASIVARLTYPFVLELFQPVLLERAGTEVRESSQFSLVEPIGAR